MPVNVNIPSAQIAATTTTARTAYPANDGGDTNAVTIHNLGTVHVHVKSGSSTVTATNGSDMFVPPSSSRTFFKGTADTHLAAITGSGAATVLFYKDSI
jgi:P pilus assembly chaperone PapD